MKRPRSDLRTEWNLDVSRVMLLLALVLTAPVAAYHPNQPQGFDPERSYQGGLDQIDRVDLFTGRLSLGLPIGPFQLNYNSNIWRYQPVVESGQLYLEASPDRETNVGLGWHLGWGEVYSPSHWYNTSGRWLYVGADGGRHVFYGNLHRGEDDGDSLTLYSRDNSYLRMRRNSQNYYVDIELPDGTTRRFNSFTGGLNNTYRLQKVWNRFASASDPDLSVSYNSDYTQWTATDRHGRTHIIHLDDHYAFINLVITRVDVESFGGARQIYDFTYSQIPVSRSCKDDYPGNSDRISMPHLVRIDLPDGSFYEMTDAGGQPDYYNVCEGGIDDVPGVLRGIRLPTGGRLGWSFQQYEFPPTSNHSVFATSAGVARRELIAKSGAVLGTWSYKTSSIGASGGNDPEVYTEVVYPTGDCTKHFFNGRYWVTPTESRGWEYGLPFVYSEQHDGHYLSTQVWTGSTAGGSCSGTKLRSGYVRFRRDETPSGTVAADWYNTNRVVEASRTVFHDDGHRWADVEYLDFNGLGNFRHVRTYGNLWSGSANNETRVAYTNYNRTSGVYPGNYQPIGPSTSWILGIYDFAMTADNDAVGEDVSWSEFGFDGTTGALTCQRTYETGTSRGPNDLLSVFLRDSSGQVTDIKTYGGDLQTLSTSGGDCGTLPARPDSWITHTYQYGVLKSSRPRTSTGGQWPYLTYDVDLDPSTGLVTASRDPSGFRTEFSFDASGRPLSVTPQEGAQISYSYTNATSSAPAKVSTIALPAGSGGALAESESWLDDFGRPWREREKLPGGVWSEREVLYNARGWTESVSEWGRLSKVTRFLELDPFGRPHRVRPPDGAAHDVLVSYQGLRAVTTQTKVAQAGGEAYVSRTREVDRYGRLRRVLEPSGLGGSTTITTYGYDVAGRLTEILTGSNPQQRRAYAYDNRGFLLSETQPEKGALGNGAVLYRDFDSSGRPHRITDGPNDLSYSYDLLGRPTTVRDRLAANRLVRDFSYDGGLGRGEGKIWRATQHNWLIHNGVEVAFPVEEFFAYQGLGGSVSQKTTTVGTPVEDFIFHQSYAHDDLGQVTEITYPACTLADCFSATGPGRQVQFDYEMGKQIAIPGWASSIQYHPSGIWSQIQHANGVTDHQAWDPSFSRRIYRTFTTGADDNYNSGFLGYDGVGNVSSMGSDTFVYDAVSRLTDADVLGHQQQFTYDPFGNLTSIATTPPTGNPSTVDLPVASSTNRLLGADYDGAGNLVASPGISQDYDRSNNLVKVGGFDYLYNTAGERTAIFQGWQYPSKREVTFTLRGLGNERLSVFKAVLGAGKWYPRIDYVYAGARVIGQAAGSGGSAHYHLDNLGSARLMTKGHGPFATHRQDFLPYGEEVSTPVSPSERVKFTGHERDVTQAGGLDYMHARHYASHLGRFMSVDKLRGTASSPQSLNRYAYVLGNPATLIDPNGLAGLDPNAHAGEPATAVDAANQAAAGLFFLDLAALEFVSSAGAVRALNPHKALVLSTAGILALNQSMVNFATSAYILRHDTYPVVLLPGDLGYGEIDLTGMISGVPTPDLPKAKVSDEITVIGETPKLPSIPMIGVASAPIGITVIEDATGNTRAVLDDPNPTLSGLICSAGGVVCVGVTGSAQWIAENEDRIETELNAWVGLSSLQQGGCFFHPTVCSPGYSF